MAKARAYQRPTRRSPKPALQSPKDFFRKFAPQRQTQPRVGAEAEAWKRVNIDHPDAPGPYRPYLDSAPVALKALHRRLKGSQRKALLGRLLTDPEMEPAWQAITQALTAPPGKRLTRAQRAARSNPAALYEQLWTEILMAFIRSKREPEPRGRTGERFKRIARDAKRLVQAIQDGPLDRPLYEFLPSQARRVRAANRLARKCWWLSVTCVIDELANHAIQYGERVATTPRRPVDRKTWARRFNFFARTLVQFFRERLGRPMTRVVATIAAVAFPDLDRAQTNEKAVRHAIRHAGHEPEGNATVPVFTGAAALEALMYAMSRMPPMVRTRRNCDRLQRYLFGFVDKTKPQCLHEPGLLLRARRPSPESYAIDPQNVVRFAEARGVWAIGPSRDFSA